MPTATERYLTSLFEKHSHKYGRLIQHALEGGLKLRSDSNFEALKAVFEALYDRHYLRRQISNDYYYTKYHLSPLSFHRYRRKLEEILGDYLKQVDERINRYIALFTRGMQRFSKTSDDDYVGINVFLDAVFDSESGMDKTEAERFFCRYFYLLGFVPKKGRISHQYYQLYITPEKSDMFLNLKIRRES